MAKRQLQTPDSNIDLLEPGMKQQADITVMENPRDAVRKLPDVYIGAVGNPGFMNMIREIVQNSGDQISKGYSINKNIIVSYNAITHDVTVQDFGQGIPIDKLVQAFSVLHSSSNYDKKLGSGDYSAGKNGMGATIVNFLSEIYESESYRLDGSALKVKFIEGLLKDQKSLKGSKDKHGLYVHFKPSKIMQEITITVEEVGNLLWEQCHFYPIGTTITYNSIDNNGNSNTIIYENKKGFYEILDTICQTNLLEPIVFSDNDGNHALDILFTYDTTNIADTVIISSANMCHTTSTGSTHVDGSMDAIVKYFRDYMNKIYIPNTKNKKLQVIAQDIRTGFRGVVCAKSISPLFTGQSKEVYSEMEMKKYTYNVVLSALNQWGKSHPIELEKIGKYIKSIAEIRTSIDNQKVKLQNVYTSSVVTGLPSKYKKPNGKLKELIIVEGDSAIGGIENNRDKESQGLFPIKGKISNAMTTPENKFFENPEIAGMFKIMGYNGYTKGKKFDPSLFKPEKVIIASDADSDGSHIACLVLIMFLKYLPFVVQEGKLYVANPPLYGLSLGNGKMKFFANNVEYVEYIQSLFMRTNVIANIYTNKPLSKAETLRLLYDNMDYVTYLHHVSSIYSIDPVFLEFLLYNKDLKFKEFKKTIEKTFRFVNVYKQNQTIVITGLVGNYYQTVFFDDRLLYSCKEVIDLIDKNSIKYYLLNGMKVSLYGIMNEFENIQPSGITRYKGLGELKPELLGETTIIPGMGRTLRQFTVDDIKDTADKIYQLQSDKSQFVKAFKGFKVRKEDIE